MWFRKKQEVCVNEEYDSEETEILRQINKYTWYHKIKLTPRVETNPFNGGFPDIWKFILAALTNINFQDKRVLDIGCRDCFFSLEAEKRGAREIVAIDNDLSPGAKEFLIPFFKSKVKMEEVNLYSLEPGIHGQFDVILFFGVLYHLRYPFHGLKKIIDCLNPGGTLSIETGMLMDDKNTKDIELLYCPFENSPYEPTSCTFYNKKGLTTALNSLGMELIHHDVLGGHCLSKDGRVKVNRQFFQFVKNEIPQEKMGVNIYWDGIHKYHSEETKEKNAGK